MLRSIAAKIRQSNQLAALVALVTLAVYLRVVHYDFVSFDDVIHVYGNRYFVSINGANLRHFWIRPYYSLYIPVSYMAFALLTEIARTSAGPIALDSLRASLDPHVFHCANLLLHTLNAVLVYHLIRRFVKADVPALFGAVLFALHPLQVESVAWISELRGLLCCFFSLCSILVYTADENERKDRRRFLSLAAIILYALSLLSKPSVVMVPFALLLWETGFAGKRLKPVAVALLPWIVLAAIDTAVTRAVQPLVTTTPQPILERIVIAFDSLGFYVEKLVWPTNLAAVYGRTPEWVLASGWRYSAFPFLLLPIVLCVLLGKGRPWLITSVLTFFLFLLPVCGIVPFAYQYLSTVADHYAYFALIGPAIGLAFALKEVMATQSRSFAYAAASIALCLLCGVTTHQESTWRNSTTLFQNTVTVNPSDWFGHEKLGNEFLGSQNYLEAERDFRVVVVRGPVDSTFWLKLGHAEQGLGRDADAIDDYNKALTITPNYGLALNGRAECEDNLGESAQAVADYRRALLFLPPATFANYELAMDLGRVGQYASAASEFRQTISRHPDYLPTYYFLALTYTKMHEPQEAAAIAKQALMLDPKYTPVYPFCSVAAATLDVKDGTTVRLPAADHN